MNSKSAAGSMSKTIYFHIGTVKTGSTYLQKLMWENREIFQEFGLCYLRVTPPALQLPRYANGDFLHDASLHTRARTLIEDSKCDNILISDEGISGYPDLVNLPMFDGFNKRIIIYLRQPAQLIAAWAAESAEPYNAFIHHNLGQQGPMYFEAGLTFFERSYAEMLRRCFTVFEALGQGNVLIRPYQKEMLQDGDLLTDFLSIFEIDSNKLTQRLHTDIRVNINQTKSRHFIDISYLVWKRLREAGRLDKYSFELVTEIAAKCKSGDHRHPIETMSDATISRLCKNLEFVETEVSKLQIANGPFFLNRLPEIYGREREPYIPIDAGELELLVEFFILRDEKNELVEALRASEIQRGLLDGSKRQTEQEREELRATLRSTEQERDKLRATVRSTEQKGREVWASLQKSRQKWRSCLFRLFFKRFRSAEV
jgi:hypothetical protein